MFESYIQSFYFTIKNSILTFLHVTVFFNVTLNF